MAGRGSRWLNNIRSTGSITISGITVNGNRVSPGQASMPPGPSLYRGATFDTELQHEGLRISLDLGGSAHVADHRFGVQVFPEAKPGKLPKLEFLRRGALTPWGWVEEITCDPEAQTWTYTTELYPEGVTYRAHAGVIAGLKK